MTFDEYDDDEQFEEINPQFYLEEHSVEEEFEEDEDQLTQEFVDRLIDKMMQFMHVLVGHDLHSYQKPLSRRIIEAVLIGKGDEITALASRQSGKSETVADTVAMLMVLLPKLAKIYPDLLGKYKDVHVEPLI